MRRNLDIAPDSERATDLIARIVNWHDIHNPKWATARREITDGYNYLAGIHPLEKQKKWFDVQRRPLRTFNLIFPQFNQTIGDFLLNEETPRVFNHIGGRKDAAKAHEDLLDRANIVNDFRSIGAKWAIAGLVKIGWLTSYWGDKHDPDGGLVYKWCDEGNVIFDSAAREDLVEDATGLEYYDWLTMEEILAKWPNHRSKLKESLTSYKEGQQWPESGPNSNDFFNPEYFNEFSGRYKIIEHNERDIERLEVATDSATGLSEIFYLEGRKADLFLQTHPNVKLIKRFAKVKKKYYVLPALNFLLESTMAALQDETYDYINFSAYNYGIQTIDHFGIIRNARDPMDDFNDWRNLQNDVMRKVVDPGHTYVPQLMQNPDDVELYGSQTGVNFKVKSNTTRQLADIIRRNDMPALPFGPDQMSMEAADFLNKITNISPNISGRAETKNENASLFRQRVDQARIALAVIYNNMNKAKRRFYNKNILINQKYLTFEKWYAFQKPAQDRYEFGVNVKVGEYITNNITVGKYEVFTEALDKNPSIKAIRFAQKTEAVNILLKIFGEQLQNPIVIAYLIQWWLSDSDLGDVEKLIKVIQQALTQQAQAAGEEGQEEQAVQRASDIMTLAQQYLSMENNGNDDPSTGQPATASAKAS